MAWTLDKDFLAIGTVQTVPQRFKRSDLFVDGRLPEKTLYRSHESHNEPGRKATQTASWFCRRENGEMRALLEVIITWTHRHQGTSWPSAMKARGSQTNPNVTL